MDRFKLGLWVFCCILLILFLPGKAQSIETEGNVFGFNSVRSLGGNHSVKKEVALTFDDAPSPFTKEVLEILDDYKI